MATATLTDCTQLDSIALERVKYFSRQLLTADDMTADQDYFRNKMRRHNRYLHGWGVVCGMQVTVAPGPNLPWQVQIGAGYALGPYGDEIYIPNPVLLDLAQCGPGAETDPCDPGSLLRVSTAKTGATLFIAVRYEECLARPVRVAPGGCGCSDTTCEPSRIRDTFQIDCLAELPPSNQPGQSGPSICDLISGRALAQCPPCPADPWVVLAQVTLPVSSASTLNQQQIDNFVRRQLFSTAMIQDQVIRCCCSAQDRRPARVTSINPAPGSVFTNATTVPPSVIITFSKSLQPATVNTNTIQVLRIIAGAQSVLLQGTVTYDDGNHSAQFVPAQAFTVPAVYQVTVVGSGPSAIMDNDNLALDGNDDGQPGGNFQSQFTVQTPSPTPTPTPTATPTPTGAPIVATVTGPTQPPRVAPNQVGLVGNLIIDITGGTAGQTVLEQVLVTLSAPIGANQGAADTAQLVDDTGNTFTATKGPAPNTYTFTNVKLAPPGTSGRQRLTISNMKVVAPPPTTAVVNVQALVSMSGVIPVSLVNPTQTVAVVLG